MSDTREDIAVRLKELLDAMLTAGDFVRVYRNTTELPENARPAAVLFDGNEQALDDGSKLRLGTAPKRVIMRPHILLALASQPDTVGTELNGLRRKLVYAIQGDSELQALSLNTSGVSYEGCEAFVANGRMIEGTLVLHFAITYNLRHSDLAP